MMNLETEIAGRTELEAALERANLDVRVATAEYDAAKEATLSFKRSHPQLDPVNIIDGVAYIVVNGHFASSTLKEFCSREEKARQRFSEALRVRADLLRQLKRV